MLPVASELNRGPAGSSAGADAAPLVPPALIRDSEPRDGAAGSGLERPALWWATAWGWWTINGFASASQYQLMRGSSEDPITWADALRTAMASAYLWVPLTVLAVWLAGRFPLERGRWIPHLAVHFGAAIFVCLFRAVAVVLLNPWVGWYAELPPFSRLLATSLFNNFLFYWMLVGVAHAVHYARRYRERERQLARAELQALKNQLHPHFLFNTLNTISAFVHQDANTADRMIARLSDLLRNALDGAGTQEVPLQAELEFLEPYLEIEQTRFEDRLTVRWNVDPSTLDARVPHLILQPLVENAVRHGISPRTAPGTVEIRSWRADGWLYLQVRDDGIGLAGIPRLPGSQGVGLANTRARLAQMYGSRHHFELRGAAEGGAVATISIPFTRWTASGAGQRRGEP